MTAEKHVRDESSAERYEASVALPKAAREKLEAKAAKADHK
jgi:hypothetical protein